MTTTPTSPLDQVRAATARLSQAAENAIASMRGHDLATLNCTLATGETQSFPLINGVWVDSFPGMRLNLIDDEKHCGGCPAAEVCSTTSRVLMETRGPIELPSHYHEFDETVHVIHGTIQDLMAPKETLRRRATDMLYFPAGVMHQPFCDGLFLICWSPPLIRVPLANL